MTAFKLKYSSAGLAAALIAAFPMVAQAAGAARIDFATGDVKAVAPDGRSRALAKGAEVVSGEMIDTGSGRAQVRFTDGAQVSLQPQTQFRIDEYRFAGKADGSEKGFFSLLKGGLRTITGLVGRSNRDNYKVTTTVATIGIRGTEYSVSYGNSINVTTGEGIVEVCNAAGCLIVNSGETAYVPDSNTRPVISEKKTELPPPPVERAAQQQFTVAEETTESGTPAVIATTGLVSGPGYSFAGAGQGFDGASGASGWRMVPAELGYFQTYATFDSNGALTGFSATDGGAAAYSEYGEVGVSGTVKVTAGKTAGALTDGVMGWGRWITATVDDNGMPYNLQNVHYVVGLPTPLADMDSLQLGSMVGTYALSGYTYPTAWNGSTTMAGTQPISGSLTADFYSAQVMGNLNVPMGGHVYSSSWYGGIGGSSFFGSGYVASSGSDCASSSCYAEIAGFFAGSKASRAGLVYQFDGTTYGTISGAAVFSQTGLAASPPY